jgi:DNA repair exonuclease SbcCD ATPase subunit
VTDKADIPDTEAEEEPPLEPREAEPGVAESPPPLSSGGRSVGGRIAASGIIIVLAAFAVIEFKAGKRSYTRRFIQYLSGRYEKAIGWTPEQIAQNPEGYLEYATETIKRQKKEREEQLASLSKRKVEIEQKATALETRVSDIQNVHDRLQTACRRADDEDRWPVKMGNRTFDKETSQAVLASAEKYVEDRKPLVSAYRDARQKLIGTEAVLRTDIEKLDQLGEKVALDLERVRLNKGMAELEELKQTEAALASFSGVVVDVSEDPSTLLSIPSSPPAKGQIDVEQLLK